MLASQGAYIFIPELPGWEERSRFVSQQGVLAVYEYDFYAQALSKIERGHTRDREDIEAMLARGLIARDKLEALFTAIEPMLYRYPAIDAATFRRAVQAVTRPTNQG